MTELEFGFLIAEIVGELESIQDTRDTFNGLIAQVKHYDKIYTRKTRGAGKYSSQAKHYLSQDYYTFVDTMPKKRFL